MSKNRNAIGISSVAGDIHAQFIAATLENRFSRVARVFDSDKLMVAFPSAQISTDNKSYQLKDSRGELVDVNNLSSIWWRRFSASQTANEGGTEKENLANASFKSIFVGMLIAQDCTFISHPSASSVASNKIFQLNTAASIFSFVPSTIATNDLEKVKEHFSASSEVIIKPLEHAENHLIFTKMQAIDELNQADLNQCPILIQEKITAGRHLRVNQFGQTTQAYAIESADLDWREDLKNAKIYEVDLDNELAANCWVLLQKMGLKMGIFDFIEDKNGDIYFIEVNPQGQFLFLQPYSSSDISEIFCEFLVSANI